MPIPKNYLTSTAILKVSDAESRAMQQPTTSS